jgi:hypothetical protein
MRLKRNVSIGLHLPMQDRPIPEDVEAELDKVLDEEDID